MTLKTLEASNAECLAAFRERTANVPKEPNGIACPECGEELQDIVGLMLTSYPLKVPTECPGCGCIGDRIR